MAGPLAGLKIVELVGIGPGPFAAMLLADQGADVLRIHRVESVERGRDPGGIPVIDRNRRSVGVDLKQPAGSRRCCASSSPPTRSWKASGPGSPSGSASGRSRAWPATRRWSTAG